MNRRYCVTDQRPSTQGAGASGTHIYLYKVCRLRPRHRAILRFHVVPHAKANEVTGEHGGAIKIKLRAAAREGKANAALRSLLAQELKISQRAIVLEHGEKSRDKLIRIDGPSEEEVRASLFRTKNGGLLGDYLVRPLDQ
jgi:uncharacterized protein